MLGRCLLASSHAGTRLPIADLQDPGRSPSVRHSSGSCTLLSQNTKNRGIPVVVSPKKRAQAFPTAALSTSGIRVEGETFLSACTTSSPCIFSCTNKTGDNPSGASCKKSLCMTSYGGIIRIRLRVEVRLLPLSLQHKLPCIYFTKYYTPVSEKNKALFV